MDTHRKDYTLDELRKEFYDQFPPTQTKNIQRKNYKVDELKEIEGLSARACNVCERHGLKDLESIIKYYKNHKNFLDLHNSGWRTDQELTLLCQLYDDGSIISEEDKAFAAAPRFPAIQPLSQLQLQILNDFACRKLANLSQRGQNCITTFLQGTVTFEGIYRGFIEGKTDIVIDLPNSGTKTEEELTAYIKELQGQYLQILDLGEDGLQMEGLKGWLYRQYQVTETEFEPFNSAFLENRLPLFRLIDFLIRSEKIFPKRKALIFERRSGYFKGVELETLEDLARMLDLTRERVRQLAERAFEDFEEAIPELATQSDLLCSVTRYEWDFGGDFLFTSNAYANTLNQSETVSFRPAFFTRILSVLTGGTHQLLAGKKKTSQQDYLIKKELFEVFDFPAFLEDVTNQLEADIPKDYNLNFEGYLVFFLKNQEYSMLLRISQVCQAILLQEFSDQISFGFDGNLIFHRNTTVRVTDYAIEVLNEEKRPINIHKIIKRINALHPDYEGDIENLRSYLNKGKDIFICFGRTSTYGLREWEGNIEGIKGGTIRSIVEEYLEQFDEPKHISEILDYVLKFRPKTNERSVIGNLKLEESNRFKGFNGSFWGIADKTYPAESLQLKNLPGFINSQIFVLLRKTGGMPFDRLVTHFCQSLQLKGVQVDYQLRKLIQEGKLSLSESGMVYFLQD